MASRYKGKDRKAGLTQGDVMMLSTLGELRWGETAEARFEHHVKTSWENVGTSLILKSLRMPPYGGRPGFPGVSLIFRSIPISEILLILRRCLNGAGNQA